MKYTVKYTCGHEGVVDLYGSRADREKAIYGYENFKSCPVCYKKELEEKALDWKHSVALYPTSKGLTIRSNADYAHKDVPKSLGFKFDSQLKKWEMEVVKNDGETVEDFRERMISTLVSVIKDNGIIVENIEKFNPEIRDLLKQ